MKRIKNVYIILGFILSLLLLFGFTFSSNGIMGSMMFAYQDSTSHNGNYMGRGRMNGGMMMGRGMMGRGMMGRGMMGGMMGQTNSKNIKTDKNGNWIAPSSANKLTNPLNDIAKASREGKSIFNAQCFTCHGTDGKGDGPVAVSLHPKPANLTSNRVQQQSDGAIYWEITNGNSPMPSFKNALSANQRWELVDYIRQLAK